MTRSLRIPLLAFAAALGLAAAAACGDSKSQFGEPCSIYSVPGNCEAPNACFARVGQNYICTKRCEADKDCPTSYSCLTGGNTSTGQQDLFCFKKDAGIR